MMNSFKIDILDKKDSYVLEAELPGFEKENINVSVDGEYLTIKAVKVANNSNDANNMNNEQNENVTSYVRKERAYGSYERSFHIPNIDSNLVEAEYKNGMLQVTMPKMKKEEKMAKQISIK